MAKQNFDWWSLSFLVVPLLEVLGYMFLDSDLGTPVVLLLIVLALCSFSLMAWTCVSHDYRFTQTGLLFRAGPFHKTVPLDDIFEVMPTDDGVPKSRGAVRIRFYTNGIAGDSFMMIPRNQSEFIAEMASRCPHLGASGEGLKRAALKAATA